MYQRILVPVDGSPTSKRGLEEAIGIAKLTHGRLRLFHVTTTSRSHLHWVASPATQRTC